VSIALVQLCIIGEASIQSNPLTWIRVQLSSKEFRKVKQRKSSLYETHEPGQSWNLVFCVLTTAHEWHIHFLGSKPLSKMEVKWESWRLPSHVRWRNGAGADFGPNDMWVTTMTYFVNTDTLCCSIFTVIYAISLITTSHTNLHVFKNAAWYSQCWWRSRNCLPSLRFSNVGSRHGVIWIIL